MPVDRRTLPSILLTTLISFLFCAEVGAVDNCETTINDPPVSIRLTKDSKEVATLKKWASLLEKLPFIKKAELELSGSLSYHHGLGCCPGASDPTPYIDYQGDFDGSLKLVFVGLPGVNLRLEADVPIPWTGIDVFGIVVATCQFTAGGELDLKGTIVGRDSACTCVLVNGKGSVSPQFCGILKGRIAVGFTDRHGRPHSVDKGLAATICLSTEYSVESTRHFGGECTDDEIKACIGSPVLDVETDINLPFGLTAHLHKEINVDDLLGLDNPTCF